MPNAGLAAAIASDDLLLGHFVMEFATPGIGPIAAAAGTEFLVLDMEHSGFGFETVKQVALGCRLAGLPLAVRVPAKQPDLVGRALDMGAEAVMAPMVSSAEEARVLAAATRYPPAGRRGVATMIAHDLWRGGDLAEKLAAANERSFLIAQIETKEGVEAADAIAATPGVGCLWIGHMDLSCALGINGAFDDPRFRRAEEKVARAARKHGRRFGRLAATAEEAATLAGRGYDMLAVATDIIALQEHLRAAFGHVRASAPRPATAGVATSGAQSRRAAR
jgi:2-dehydro-3-deoxyglucarate aldolase/4-hydroxy-2-oxoheptanedioate aldolase